MDAVYIRFGGTIPLQFDAGYCRLLRGSPFIFLQNLGRKQNYRNIYLMVPTLLYPYKLLLKIFFHFEDCVRETWFSKASTAS